MHGIKRLASSFNTQRVDHTYQDPHIDNCNFVLHYSAITDTSKLLRILQQVQQDQPKDFVIATVVEYSLREFIQWTAEELGITKEFSGRGVNKIAVVKA